MPSPTELHYTIVLRAKNRDAGTDTNNFTVQMPISLPTFTQYYKIRLVQMSLPVPNHTFATTSSPDYDTGSVEVCCDFGGRTNSFDTARTSLQSYGFFNIPKTNYNYASVVSYSHYPEHIVANPNFSNVRIQLKNSDGNLLKTVGSSVNNPEEAVLIFQFTPIRMS